MQHHPKRRVQSKFHATHLPPCARIWERRFYARPQEILLNSCGFDVNEDRSKEHMLWTGPKGEVGQDCAYLPTGAGGVRLGSPFAAKLSRPNKSWERFLKLAFLLSPPPIHFENGQNPAAREGSAEGFATAAIGAGSDVSDLWQETFHKTKPEGRSLRVGPWLVMTKGSFETTCSFSQVSC